MKLLCLNIEIEKHIPEIETLLQREQPDVACFQEISFERFAIWKNQFFKDGAFADMTSKDSVPMGEWGVAILSQSSLQSVKQDMYDAFTEDYPEKIGKRSERPLATVLTVTADAMPEITIATTHFTWTADGEATDEQRINVERLIKALDPHKDIIICGDFNAPRHREIFTYLSQHFSDNIPSSWESSIDPELHRAGPLQLMVDGLFSRGSVQVSDCRKICGVSDHCAIVARVEEL